MTHAEQVNHDHRKCEPAYLFHRHLRPARYAATATPAVCSRPPRALSLSRDNEMLGLVWSPPMNY